VSYDVGPFDAEVLEQVGLVVGHDVEVELLEVIEVRLLGIAVPAQIGHDDIEALGELSDALVPLPPEAGPPMHEQQRRA
jgi:hypothetical protein